MADPSPAGLFFHRGSQQFRRRRAIDAGFPAELTEGACGGRCGDYPRGGRASGTPANRRIDGNRPVRRPALAVMFGR